MRLQQSKKDIIDQTQEHHGMLHHLGGHGHIDLRAAGAQTAKGAQIIAVLTKDKVKSSSCFEGIRNCFKRMICTREEYRMLQVSDKLWRAVNVDNRSTLDASGAMLLMKVLDGDSRWALATHPWGHKKETIDKFTLRLKDATNASSSSGANISPAEFRDAFLGAVRIHAHQTAEQIIKDLVYEYDKMQGKMHLTSRQRAHIDD